jgi:hypothetical protein
MKKEEVQELNYGLYRLYWKKRHGGGSSLAVVGGLHDGAHWFACSNWTSKCIHGIKLKKQYK